MPSPPLTSDEIEARLAVSLDPVLSPRRTADAPARALTKFSLDQQEFVLRWVDVISKTNPELAFQFTVRVPEALRSLTFSAIEDWVIHAMDVYDTNGLYPACAAIHNLKRFETERGEMARAAHLSESMHILELFLCGLSGRSLEIKAITPSEIIDGPPGAVPETYTDTAALYLPTHIHLFDTHEDNYRVYRAIVGYLWAQVRFGTFRPSATGENLTEILKRYPDREKALRLFHALETVRLNACLARELPGLDRDMVQLQAKLAPIRYPMDWESAVEQLRRPQASVVETYQWLDELLPHDLPPPLCYQGVLYPDRTLQAMRDRAADERRQFSSAFAEFLAKLSGQAQAQDGESKRGDIRRRIRMRTKPDRENSDDAWFKLTLDGKAVEPPAHLKDLIHSIIQDFGEVPDDYLNESIDDDHHRGASSEKAIGESEPALPEEKDAILYDEWDFRRRHYRKNWCALREVAVHPGKDSFVEATREKYAGALRSLRRTFEALRREDRLLKRQMTGDDIDFDALVEGYADMRSGRELPQRLFTKLNKLERDIAVLFMVDMSGSTKGWINDAERESLVLLCEALEVLGDRYAIYGFSGMTRKRCELYRIKRFNEMYTDEVRERISGIKPQDYTRMGVIIRHLVKLFEGVEARTKLLITLSDGKPDDYDGYRGDYGIEDTRMALVEAKHVGIHPFCITIDTEARDYLPHMYGAVNWTLVNSVHRLPVKVSEIYRKLTL